MEFLLKRTRGLGRWGEGEHRMRAVRRNHIHKHHRIHWQTGKPTSQPVIYIVWKTINHEYTDDKNKEIMFKETLKSTNKKLQIFITRRLEQIMELNNLLAKWFSK